ELARVLRDGFTAEELDTARSGWLQGRTVARSQDQQLAARMANDLFLERTLKWDADLERKVAALTVEQVNAAVRKHISLEAVTIVKAGDFAHRKSNQKIKGRPNRFSNDSRPSEMRWIGLRAGTLPRLTATFDAFRAAEAWPAVCYCAAWFNTTCQSRMR